jgi:hypothetical protein
MRRRRRRRCRYCRELFRPEPHIKNQRSCGSPACSQARQSEANQKWLMKPANREYFCGRYERLRAWLSKPENRGYLRRYRQMRRERAAPDAPRPKESSPTAAAFWPRRKAAERPDIQDA